MEGQMTKTIPLNEDVHKYLKKIQSILYHEYNIEMRLQDILAYIVNDKIATAHKMADMISVKEELTRNKSSKFDFLKEKDING